MNILALDLGTSSVRGLVLDADTQPLPGALARRKVSLAIGDDGTGTLSGPDYLACLIECLDELASGGHLHDVDLVAISAQWHSVLPLDRDGTPLGPVVTWLDTRPVPIGGAPGPTDPDGFHQRTGCWWHRSYWSVRLPWLREHSGTSIARFVGLPEYVLGELLDDAPMSVSQASGTGLLDLSSMRWDGEALTLAGARPRTCRPWASWTGTGGCAPSTPAAGRNWRRPAGLRRWATVELRTSARAVPIRVAPRSPSAPPRPYG
ncbi:hypothetical protein GCM10027614_21590 [Micromonospora vulcania]